MKRNNIESNPYYRCSLNRDRINPDCNKSRSLKEIVLKEVWLTICRNFSKSKYSTDNSLVRDKIRLFRKNLYQNKFNEFDEKIFSKLIHSVIFDNVINVKHIYFISFIICFLYASSDEFHQLFVPGRSGQVTNIFIDLIGVVLGLLLVKE